MTIPSPSKPSRNRLPVIADDPPKTCWDCQHSSDGPWRPNTAFYICVRTREPIAPTWLACAKFEPHREIERTCGMCSDIIGPHGIRICDNGDPDVAFVTPNTQACAAPANGWDIDWQGSELRWVAANDQGLWFLFESDADLTDTENAFGMVTYYCEQRHAREKLMWGSRLVDSKEKIEDAARALISAYREREGRKL